jgi:hypothetical protein
LAKLCNTSARAPERTPQGNPPKVQARSKLSTIAIAVYLVATPAAAAEFTHRPQVNGPDVITIRGEIDADDYKKFIEIASDIMHASVILNSKGGHIAAAISIGRFIRLRNYDTRLHNGGACNSACTLIWLAGTFRHLDRYARLGFHSAATTRRPPYKRSEVGNAAIAAYMASMGVPQQVIDLQPKADPCCLNYVEYAQAKAWGLVSDRPAKQQQSLPTPKTHEPGSQQAAGLAKAGICRCVKGQLLPSDCKGACVGSICLGYCKPERPIAEQSRKLLAPETQQPATTAPASPKIKMLVVRPVTPLAEPVPQQAPATSAPALGAQPTAPDDRHPASTYNALIWAMRPTDLLQRRALALWEIAKPDASPEPAAKVEAPPHAARPKITDRIEPGSQQAPAAQKVVLYEEDPADPNGKRFVGLAIWRTETVTPALGQPPELAIRADIEVPERKLAVTWSLRRNTDKGLPATHTVEIMFKLPSDFPAGGISNVPGILMKQAEQTRGVPLAGLAVKVTPGFYLIGLSNLDADKERNLQLLMERGWFDIPVVYNNNRRAILVMEKGTPGERVFADAFRAWKQ